MYSMSLFNTYVYYPRPKKHIFFYSNEVGGAFRGTRQGPVLEYLVSCVCRVKNLPSPLKFQFQ